jgi:hypothetical protein
MAIDAKSGQASRVGTAHKLIQMEQNVWIIIEREILKSKAKQAPPHRQFNYK